MLEKTEGKRRRRRQRLRWLDGITDSVDCIWANSRRQQRTEEPGVLQSVGHKVRHDLVTEQQNSAGKILWTKNSDFSKSSPFRRSSYFTHTRTPLAPVSPAPLSLTNLLEQAIWERLVCGTTGIFVLRKTLPRSQFHFAEVKSLSSSQPHVWIITGSGIKIECE